MQGLLDADSAQGAAHETTGNLGRSARSHSRQEMPKKRPRVCKLDIPSKKPHHPNPAERMMSAKEKVHPSHAKRTKYYMILKLTIYLPSKCHY